MEAKKESEILIQLNNVLMDEMRKNQASVHKKVFISLGEFVIHVEILLKRSKLTRVATNYQFERFVFGEKFLLVCRFSQICTRVFGCCDNVTGSKH